MNKLLVIGANSFSGQDFVRHMSDNSNYKLTVQARTYKSDAFIGYKNVDMVYCDLNKNWEGFCSTVDRIAPDYIVNFAAQSEVTPSWDNPDHWYTTNTVLISKLAKFLTDKKWLKKYLHVSTPEMYGHSDQLIKEDQPYAPSTPYAASKMAGDICLQIFNKHFGLPVLFIRSANVCGKRQQIFKIIPRSVLFMLQGKKVPLHGGGTSIRGFTDIQDVSRGEELLLEKGNIGEIYHLSNHEFPTIREIVKTVYDELSARQKISGFFEEHIEDVPQRAGNDTAYKLNCDKIKALGWTPQITIQQSIRETVDWVLENYDVLNKLPMQYNHKP